MYEIPLILKYASPLIKGKFTKNSSEWFLRACAIYNSKCTESKANKKKILVKEQNVSADEIHITLLSEVELTKAPGRALGLLTRILIDSSYDGFDPYFADNLYHKKLFMITAANTVAINQEISDQEMVKALVDYLCMPKSTLSGIQKNGIAAIKRILVETGLYTQENQYNDILKKENI